MEKTMTRIDVSILKTREDVAAINWPALVDESGVVRIVYPVSQADLDRVCNLSDCLANGMGELYFIRAQ